MMIKWINDKWAKDFNFYNRQSIYQKWFTKSKRMQKDAPGVYVVLIILWHGISTDLSRTGDLLWHWHIVWMIGRSHLENSRHFPGRNLQAKQRNSMTCGKACRGKAHAPATKSGMYLLQIDESKLGTFKFNLIHCLFITFFILFLFEFIISRIWMKPRSTVVEATRHRGQGIRRINIWLEQREQNMWWHESHMSHSSDSSWQIQQVFLRVS